MPRRPSMETHSMNTESAMPLKKSLNGLSSGTPNIKKPSVGLPPLIHAASPNRSRLSSWS